MHQDPIEDLSMENSVLAVLAANLETLRHTPTGYLSQREMATKVSIDQTTIGRIVNLKGHWPSLEVVAKLAAAFRKQTYQLLMPDMGERANVDDTTLSVSAIHLARKFDAIKDEGERAKAYAYISQALEFANFTHWPAGPRSTPPAATPKPARVRRKSPGSPPKKQS